MNRSRSYTIAAILQFVLSAGSVVDALIMLPRGATALDQVQDTPPYFIVVIMLIVGALGLVSSYGVWRVQKWGVILTILLRVIDSMAALPGVLWAPTSALKALAAFGVAASIVIIVLLLRGESRAAWSEGAS